MSAETPTDWTKVSVAVAGEVRELRAERDDARNVARALEKQLAEALDIAQRAVAYYDDPDSAEGEDYHLIAELFLRDIVRILAPSSLAEYEALGAPVGDEEEA